MEFLEADSNQVSPPVGMRSANGERLLVECLLEARALPTTVGIARLEPRLAKSAIPLPEVRDRAVREPERSGDVGKRLASSMASDDLLANRLGDCRGHGVPPGDQCLQGPV